MAGGCPPSPTGFAWGSGTARRRRGRTRRRHRRQAAPLVTVVDEPVPATESWKDTLRYHEDGYFVMDDEDTRGVPVRLFLTPSVLRDLEDSVRGQIITAARFPGVKISSRRPRRPRDIPSVAGIRGRTRLHRGCESAQVAHPWQPGNSARGRDQNVVPGVARARTAAAT